MAKDFTLGKTLYTPIHTVALSLFLTLQTLVGFAQGVNSITINPTSPTTSSSVTATIEYTLTNSCWSYAGHTIQWSGNTANVYLNFNNSGGASCPSIYTTGLQNVALGTLNAGTYTVRAWDLDQGGALLLSKTFTVSGTACVALSSAMVFSNNITSNSAGLNTTYTSATRYRWRRRASGTVSFTNLPETTTPSTTVSGLLPGITYQWQVSIRCANGVWSNWCPTQTFTTLTTSCSAPTVNQINASSITVSSAVISGPGGYSETDYQFRPLGSATWNDVPSTSSNSTTLVGLLPGTTHEYRIAVRCSNGVWSPWSPVKTFTTLLSEGCPLPPLSQVFVSNITANSAIIYGPLGYLAFDAQIRQLGTTAWNDLPGTTGTSILVTGLAPSTIYEYRFAVRCNNGVWSVWSGTQTFITSIPGIVGNDEPCGATVINSENSCNYQVLTTVNATPTVNPPAPNYLNCPTEEMNDIWVEVEMPPTGKVIIRTLAGSETDIVVAAYSGINCSSLSSFGCIDDDSNGNLMPSFVITSSLPSVWLRIWSYSGSGTFSICAQTSYGFDEDVTEGLVDGDLEERQFDGVDVDSNTGINIYPNPTKGVLHIENSVLTNTNGSLSVFDQSGRIVLSKERVEISEKGVISTLNVASLIPGVYFLKVQTDDQTFVTRFIRTE